MCGMDLKISLSFIRHERMNKLSLPAVGRDIVPLEKDEIAAKVVRKLVLVMEDVFAIAGPLNAGKVRSRDVCSLRVQRVEIGPVKLVRYEGQRVLIETLLRGRLRRGSNGTSLDLEMSFMMGR